MEDMDMDEHLIASAKHSFWNRYKSLIIGISGLCLGCFLTVGISYLFFSLGKSKNQGEVVSIAGTTNAAHQQTKAPRNNSNQEYLLFAKQDSEKLIALIQKVRNESQTELSLIKESKDEIMEFLAEIRNRSDKEEAMRDCVDWLQNGYRLNGVYSIQPFGSIPLDVYCDMTTDGGGWLVFQRRINGTVDFFRDWASYENGFGEKNGEIWLGNKYLNLLTKQPTELRIDLMDWNNTKGYVKYSTFSLGDAASKYTLYVDDYSGNAGDGLALHHKVKFSTKDQDNDIKRKDCAGSNVGAWWYENCSHSSLNGEYIRGTDGKADRNKGINWEKWKGDYYSLKTASMMLRRKT